MSHPTATLVLADPVNSLKIARRVSVLLSEPLPAAMSGTIGEMIEKRFVRILTDKERRSYVLVDVDEFCFCSRCGHALGLVQCSGCGRRYKDEYGFRVADDGVLPPSIRRWFEQQGHRFEK